MRAVTAIATVLFVISVPVLLLSTDLRLAATDIRLYEYGFDKYDASAATGLEKEELLAVAGDIITYFNSDQELLDTDVFSERAVAHMKDVKGLVQLACRVQLAALAVIVVYAVAGFVLRRGAFWRDLARRLIWGSGATIALLVLVGLWALVDFESLFLLFHLAGFRNDLWQLYPGDNMLLMFPPGFFNDAALFVAGAAVVEAAIIGGAAWGLLRLRNRADSGEVSLHSGGSTGDTGG